MSKTDADSGASTTFQSNPHGTPGLDGADAALPVIDLRPDSPSAEFELGEKLGQGGMGHVLSARQHTLQRTVAIKFLNDPGLDASTLLREAITTGRLEHPNIVPVHVLAKSTEGVPFFTMKRVEGTPWCDALKSPRSLVEHLEILQRVCDALAFAHAQGVIHRDLKPANVLVGSFGEVYLVDWGLAASLKEDGVLPRARDAGLGGTPSYLAPESATGQHPLGPWTDVFLLGATLFEVLTGRAPYVGASVNETLALAAECKEPGFPATVPTELANICRTAMKRAPGERYEGVKAFKDAITGYLRHHEAHELHERTMEKLAELERAPTERLFTECRFGFEQVRRAWPEFEPARVGLRRALVLMVEHELARGAVQSARSILTELPHPPAELVIKVEDAERAEQEKAARFVALERQARELSTESAREFKGSYVRTVSLVSMASSVVLQGLASAGLVHFTTRDGLVYSLILMLNSILYATKLWRQPDTNQLQRRLSAALAGLSILSGAAWWIAVAENVSFQAAVITYYLLNATGWFTAAMAIEHRGNTVAVGFVAAAVLGTLFPSLVVGCGITIGISFWFLANWLQGATPATAR